MKKTLLSVLFLGLLPTVAVAATFSVSHRFVFSSGFMQSVSFNPGYIPNLVISLEADSVKNLPDGTSISSIADPFNAGNVFTASGGNPTKQTFRGLPVIEMVAGQILRSNSVFNSSFDKSLTVVYVSYADNLGGNQTVVSDGGIGSPLALTEQGSGTFRFNQWFPITGNVTSRFAAGQVVTYRYDGSNIILNNGTYVGEGTAKTDALGLTGGVDIGASSFGFSGKVRAVYVYNRVLSDAEVNKIVAYAAPRSSGLPGNNSYVFVGDSQTGTTGGSGSVTYPGVVKNSLDSNSIQYNYTLTDATSGWKLQDMQAGIPAAVTPWITALNTSSYETAVIWGGTNNVTAGDTGAATIGYLNSLMDALRATGVNRFVLLTCLPTTADGPSVIAERAIYNTYMRSIASPGIKIADIAALPQLMNPADTTYYNPDGLHLNDTGKTLVGNTVYPIITPW